MGLPAEQRFPRSSAVGRYWLARCEGFRAQSGSRDVGTIEQVRCASWQGDAYSLVIKGHGRRLSVSVDRVLAVDPWAETVVLAPSRRLRKQLSSSAMAATKVSGIATAAAKAAARRARRYGPVALKRSRIAATAGARGCRRAVVWGTPHARGAALVSGRWAARAIDAASAALVLLASLTGDGVAWLRPRLHGAGRAARRRARSALNRAVSRSTSARKGVSTLHR